MLDESAQTVSVSAAGVPIVVEQMLDFEPGPFELIAVAQALFPLWMHHPATAALRVHLANGLYINALFDRMIGGFRIARPH